MEPLFRVDGVGSSALLLGLVGGYPIGPRTTAELYRQGALRRDEAERLLTFSNNSNPVFLISVLGLGVFGSVRVGIWLWLIHLLSALLTGLCFRQYQTGPAGPRNVTRSSPFHTVSFSSALVESVRSACSGSYRCAPSCCLLYAGPAPFHPVFPVGPGPGRFHGAVFPDPAADGRPLWIRPLGGGQRMGRTLRPLSDGGGAGGQRSFSRPCVLGKAVQGLFSLGLALLLSSYVLS